MSLDYSARAVTEAEQLIAAGDVSRGLDKLEIAAEYVPWGDEEGASALIAQIRHLLDVVASDAQSHAPQVQAIRAALARREGVDPPVVARIGEPWFYPTAKIVAGLAIFMSFVSFVVGIVVGIKVSEVSAAFGEPTHHRVGVLLLWILSGVFSALLWLGVAAALSLLVDNGRMLRAARAES